MGTSKLNKQNSLIILLIIIAFGAGLRFISIDRDSLWLDEAISYLTANLSTAEILNNTIKDPHPPFYYLLLHYWQKLVPDSDINIRALGVIFNILLIPLVYRLTFDFFERYSLALFSAFLVAISPFHIAYSHELRMYTLLMLLTTLTVWAYWRAYQNGRWYWWLLFFLFSLLAIYTHLFSFFVLAAIGIYALSHYKHRQAFIMTVVIGFVLMMLFIPWLSILGGESEYGLGSLRPLTQNQSNSSNPIKLIVVFTFLLFGHSTTLWYSALSFFFTVSIIVIFIIEMRRVHQEGNWLALPLLILLVLCAVGLPVIIYHIRPFFLPERTMAAASPFLLILLAWSLTRMKSPLPYLAIAATITMIAGSFIYLIGSAEKPPYREVAQFVSQNQEPGDVVLHTSDGSYLSALRYANLPNHVVLAGDPDPRKPISVYQAYGGDVWDKETAVTAGERLWVIVALEHSIEWQIEQSEFFSGQYPLLSEHDFSGIKVYLYDLPE